MKFGRISAIALLVITACTEEAQRIERGIETQASALTSSNTLNTYITDAIEIDQAASDGLSPADANLFRGLDPADGTPSYQKPNGGPTTFLDWHDLGLVQASLDAHRLLDPNAASGKDPTAFPQSNECVGEAQVLSKMDLTYVGAAHNDTFAYLVVQRSNNNGDAGYYWLFTKLEPKAVLGQAPCRADQSRLLYDISANDVLVAGHFRNNGSPLIRVFKAARNELNVTAISAVDFTSGLWTEDAASVASVAVNTTKTAPGSFGSAGVIGLDGTDLGLELVTEAAIRLAAFSAGGSAVCGAEFFGSVITRSSGSGGTSPDLKDLLGPAKFNLETVTALPTLTGRCDASLDYKANVVGYAGNDPRITCSWEFFQVGQSAPVATRTGCEGNIALPPGSYTATVHAQANTGCSDTASATGSIYPVLAIAPSLGNTCSSTFTYDASVTGGSNAAGGSFAWTFAGTGGGTPTPSSSSSKSGLVSIDRYDVRYDATVVYTDPRTDAACSVSAAASITPTQNGCFVLEVTKRVDRAAASPGDALTYTVGYTNRGTAPLSNVVISDPIPAHSTFVAASGGGVYDPATNTVRWSAGTVPAGATASFTLQVTLDATFPAGDTVVSNIATIDSDQTDPTTAAASTTVTAAPAISFVKSVDRATASPGASLTYSLLYGNSGNAAATNVVITDPIPARTTFVTASAGCTFASGTVTCLIGDLPPATSRTITIQVQLDAIFPSGDTTVTNTATIDSDQTTPQSSTASTVVSASPTLSITKAVDRSTASPGDLLTYTLSYANTGNANATTVVISDAIPARSTFVSATAGGTFAAGTVTWTFATVAPGATGTVSFVVRLDSTFPSGTTSVTNSAVIDSDQSNPTPSNTVTTSVSAAPMLTISKAVDRTTASPGDLLTYTLSYGNGGNAAASNVLITDVVPARATFISATDGGLFSGGTVSWLFASVAPGTSGSVSFTVQLDAVFPNGTTSVPNIGAIDSDQTPETPSNQVVTTVTAAPVLRVVKSVDRATASPGDTLTYTLAYSNTGNANASGVSISDTIPARTTWLTGGTFANGVVTFSIGAVAAGASGSVSFTVRLDAVFPNGSTAVANSAVLSSNETGNTPSNTVTTDVNAAPVLAISKAVDRATASPGDQLTYTLSYANTGNADATSVVISDAIPARTTWVSGGSLAGGSVTFAVGTLAAGASGSVSFVVRLDAVFPSGTTAVTNSAVIDSTETAPVTSNTVTTTVDAAPSLAVTKAVDRATASPGDTLTYTLSYSNSGNADASGVTLTDAVPARTTWVSGGSFAAGTVTFAVGTVAAGASGTVSFVVRLDAVFPAGTTAVTNSAVIDSDQTTPSSSNTVTTNVSAAPVLALSKSVDRTTAAPGDLLTYTLSYSNSGNAAASNVVIGDLLRPRTTFVSATDGGVFAAGAVTWQVASVAPGASGSVSFTVQLDAVFPNGTTNVANAGTISSDQTPAAGSNEVVTAVTAAPALAVVKSVDRATAAPGDTLTYTLAYSNTGNANASGVVITDAIPARTTWVSGGSFADGNVTFTIGTLASGASGSVSFTVRLDAVFPNGTTAVANSAVLASNESGNTPSNTVTTTVDAAPALTISKAVDRTTASPGDVLVYTLSYANDGNADASGVVITDAIPARTTWVSGGSFAGGTVTFAVGTVASHGSGSVSFSVRLDAVFPSGTTEVPNSAVIDSNETGATTSNTVVTTVSAAPNLAITKAVDRATASPGDLLTYTLSYSNSGNADATGVTITDLVPARSTWVSGGSFAAGTVTFTAGTVAAGASGSVSFVVRLDATFPAGTTAVTNSAVLDSNQTDPTTSNTVTTQVSAAPVLAISKSVDQTTASPGGVLTYTLSYSNGGNAAASGVVITDAIPARTTFVSATAGGTFAAGVVTFDVGGVAPGASGSVSFTVQLDAVFPNGTTAVTNAAVIDSAETTPATSNEVTTTVSAAPVLAITKAVDRTTASPGGLLTYTLGYSNTGNADATAVTISDLVPARTTFVSASDGGALTAGSVGWSIGTIAAGASGSVSFTVRLDAVFPNGTTTVSNFAVLSSAETGTRQSNTVNTDVSAAPVVAVSKTVDRATASPGDSLVYTLTYSNSGNADATGVVITDAVPARSTFVGATGDGTLTAGTVSWTIGTLTAGASGSVSFTVRLDAVFPNGNTDVVNSAVIDSEETAPSPSNTVTTVVTAAPSLTVAKSAVVTNRVISISNSAAVSSAEGPSASGSTTSNGVGAGATITYTIVVTNGGNAGATSLVLSDVLPAETSFVSASDGGSYAAGDNTVTWSIASLAAGASATRTLVVSIGAP